LLYLSFANGVYVLIPLMLAIQAWRKMTLAAHEAKLDSIQDKQGSMSTSSILFVTFLSVSYVVMIVYGCWRSASLVKA
jgi:hypothetical protein